MSLFNIFNKLQKSDDSQKLDLEWMHADMHSHLIPGIDDGAQTTEESLVLIERLASYGLKKADHHSTYHE